jgi:hypothetical protein
MSEDKNSDVDQAERNIGLVCKHECMVKHLESIYPVLHECISKMIEEGHIAPNYYEQTNIYKVEPKRDIFTAMKKLRDEEKRLFSFVQYTFTKEYNGAHDQSIKIKSPDMCDPRFPNADCPASNGQKVVEGWQYANPECVARIFGPSDETIFYETRSETNLTPQLIKYRKELAKAAAIAGRKIEKSGHKEENLSFVWNHKWGIMYDHFECTISLLLEFSDHLSRFQPFTSEKPMLR